jgi:hypothetical protein
MHAEKKVEKIICLYKKTAKPRKTVPQRAAKLMPVLGTKMPAAAPPLLGEAVPVARGSLKPAMALVPEGVARAVEADGMDVLPRYGF